MSFFDRIKSKIFGTAHAETPAAQPAPQAGTAPAPTPAAPAGSAPAPAAPTPTPATPAPTPSTNSAAPAAGASPAGSVDVAKILDEKAKGAGQTLDWRRSIVDLLKLLDLDSSLTARKELGQELGYTGNADDSAALNTWLHRQVMTKLAANGGNVPAELRD